METFDNESTDENTPDPIYNALWVDGEQISVDASDNGELIESVHLGFDESGYRNMENGQVPLDWCNSARISVDPADDAIHVSISCGDPRGAFVITVRRLPDGSLIMHTPYPGMGFAHRPLTQLHEGTYQIS